MISCLIGILILAILLAIAYWVLTLVLGAFNFAPPANIMMLIGALLVLILFLYFLNCLGVLGGAGWPRVGGPLRP
jgi:hypothetical protein